MVGPDFFGAAVFIGDCLPCKDRRTQSVGKRVLISLRKRPPVAGRNSDSRGNERDRRLRAMRRRRRE